MPQKCLQVLNLKATFGKCTVAIYVGRMEGSKSPTKLQVAVAEDFWGRTYFSLGNFLACFLPHCFFNSMYGLKYLQIHSIKNLSPQAGFLFYDHFFHKAYKGQQTTLHFCFQRFNFKMLQMFRIHFSVLYSFLSSCLHVYPQCYVLPTIHQLISQLSSQGSVM